MLGRYSDNERNAEGQMVVDFRMERMEMAVREKHKVTHGGRRTQTTSRY